MKVEVRYLWRIKWAGRTVTSPTKMTEDKARKEHPEAVRLDHSREEFIVRDQPCEIDQANIDLVSRISIAPERLARLYRPKTLPQEADFVPLPQAAAVYQISELDGVWTVKSTTSSPHRVVYQGRGPVTVEPAP